MCQYVGNSSNIINSIYGLAAQGAQIYDEHEYEVTNKNVYANNRGEGIPKGVAVYETYDSESRGAQSVRKSSLDKKPCL